MTRLLLATLAALVLSACNNTTAGIPCTARTECEPGQDCFEAPGGFCSRGCSEPGQTRECPTGTLCTEFGRNSLVCSQPCETSADCRVNFECVQTHQGSSVSACRPVQ